MGPQTDGAFHSRLGRALLQGVPQISCLVVHEGRYRDADHAEEGVLEQAVLVPQSHHQLSRQRG